MLFFCTLYTPVKRKQGGDRFAHIFTFLETWHDATYGEQYGLALNGGVGAVGLLNFEKLWFKFWKFAYVGEIWKKINTRDGASMPVVPHNMGRRAIYLCTEF